MKKSTIEGYTVGCFIPVRAHAFRGLNAEQARDAAKDLEDELRNLTRQMRHVDEVFVRPQEDATCSHCGYRWTEKSDTYNGGCCDEDEKNNPANASREREEA